MNNMSPEQAYTYIEIHGFSPELEDIIATSALYSYLYALDILHKRFPAGEKAIANNSYYSYNYARLLDIRFYVGEKAILTDSYYSLCYARDVLGRRWLKADPSIQKSVHWGILTKNISTSNE